MRPTAHPTSHPRPTAHPQPTSHPLLRHISQLLPLLIPALCSQHQSQREPFADPHVSAQFRPPLPLSSRAPTLPARALGPSSGCRLSALLVPSLKTLQARSVPGADLSLPAGPPSPFPEPVLAWTPALAPVANSVSETTFDPEPLHVRCLVYLLLSAWRAGAASRVSCRLPAPARVPGCQA